MINNNTELLQQKLIKKKNNSLYIIYFLFFFNFNYQTIKLYNNYPNVYSDTVMGLNINYCLNKCNGKENYLKLPQKTLKRIFKIKFKG